MYFPPKIPRRGTWVIRTNPKKPPSGANAFGTSCACVGINLILRTRVWGVLINIL